MNQEMKKYWDEYYHYDNLVRERFSLYDRGDLASMANETAMYWGDDQRLDFVEESWGKKDEEDVPFKEYDHWDLKQCVDNIFSDMDGKELIEFLLDWDYAGTGIEGFKEFLKDTAEEFNLQDIPIPEPIYHNPNQLEFKL